MRRDGAGWRWSGMAAVVSSSCCHCTSALPVFNFAAA
jgi:hypothetical protein